MSVSSPSASRTEVGAGRMPAAVKIMSGREVWLIEDLDAYLDGKRGRPSDPARKSSIDNLTAEWDVVCDGNRAARLP